MVDNVRAYKAYKAYKERKLGRKLKDVRDSQIKYHLEVKGRRTFEFDSARDLLKFISRLLELNNN